MKKVLSIILVSGIIVLSIAGCGKPSQPVSYSDLKPTANFNPTGYPISKEKITLKLMGSKQSVHGEWGETKFFKDLEEKTNIKFEFKTPPKDNYTEMKNLAIASGELPDLFFNGALTPQDEINFGSQGTLIPLEGLIDKYAPNIKDMFSKREDVKKAITTPQGHIYALPNVNEANRDMVLKLWVNGEWLNNLGITKLPSTVDELYQLLKDFKEKDPNGNGLPDEIPLTSTNLFALRQIILSAFGFVEGGIEVKNDKVFFTPLEEGYKEYIKFMTKLYQEELLDKETFIHTNQQSTAKGKDNKVGMAWAPSPSLFFSTKSDADVINYPALPPLTSSVNSEKVYYKHSSGIFRGSFAITKQNKYPAETMRWVDYLYSEEGMIHTTTAGAYKWKNEEKTEWEYDFPKDADPNTYLAGKLTPNPGSVLPFWRRREWIYSEYNVMNDYLNKVSDELMPYAKLPLPLLYLTEQEQKRVSQLSADINALMAQMESKYIIGTESVNNYDKYVQTLKNIGVDELVTIYQTAYDRYKSLK